jgi:DNA repair protein RecN (Recombination protein N)
MLALKVVLAGTNTFPTIIFDEVDMGIGGATAAAVGDRLARLSEEYQVLVVTHSPQVAAKGGKHLRITKFGNGNDNRTLVDELGSEERTEEIARMLAGSEVTKAARAAANQLLACSEVEKNLS